MSGFCLVGLSVWTLGSLNLNMAVSNFVWPTMVQGIGMGLVFPNLSAAALSSIPREQMGYAASLFSMTRNIGGSIGTSVLTTMLVRKEQVQQSHLVEHVSVFDAWRMSERPVRHARCDAFQLHGPARDRTEAGLAMIYSSVQSQAMMMSLNNIYRMLAA